MYPFWLISEVIATEQASSVAVKRIQETFRYVITPPKNGKETGC